MASCPRLSRICHMDNLDFFLILSTEFLHWKALNSPKLSCRLISQFWICTCTFSNCQDNRSLETISSVIFLFNFSKTIILQTKLLCILPHFLPLFCASFHFEHSLLVQHPQSSSSLLAVCLYQHLFTIQTGTCFNVTDSG